MAGTDEVIVNFGKSVPGNLLEGILSSGAQEMHLIPSVSHVNVVRRYAADDSTSADYHHTEFRLGTTGRPPVVTASYDVEKPHAELSLNICSSFQSREQYLLNVTAATRVLKQ